MSKSRSAVIESVRSALSKPVDLDALLAKAGQRDRANVEKHLAAVDPAHATLWRRLMRSLATLAPLAIQTVGQAAVQFFIADGKYRMQVFALEDASDGHLILYTPDVYDEARKLKLIPAEGDEHAVFIEQLTGANTPNPSPHFKNMLGWNRKALRIVLPINATDEQIETAEHIAGLAARSWAGKPVA